MHDACGVHGLVVADHSPQPIVPWHQDQSASTLPPKISVLHPKADICSALANVRFGPKADISQSAAPFIIESGTGSEVRQPLRYAIVGGLPVSQILSLYTTPVIYLTLDRLRRRAAAVMYVPSKLKSSASPPYCGNTKFVLRFRLDGFYEGRIHFLSLWKCIGPGS
jgi:AcrB/AcrD/AcrF family